MLSIVRKVWSQQRKKEVTKHRFNEDCHGLAIMQQITVTADWNYIKFSSP